MANNGKKVIVVNLPNKNNKGKFVQLQILVPENFNIPSSGKITELDKEQKLVISNLYKQYLYLDHLRNKK